MSRQDDGCSTCGLRFSTCLCQQRSEAPSTLRRRQLWVGGVSDGVEESGIRQLFGVHQSSRNISKVEIRRNKFQNGQGFAFVTFENEDSATAALETFTGGDGSNMQCRPCVWQKANDDDHDVVTQDAVGAILKLDCECDGMPSLYSQLYPLSETQLRQRLDRLGAPSDVEEERSAYAKGGRLGKKNYLVRRLEHWYRTGGARRTVSRIATAGIPIRPELVDAILSELKRVDWGKKVKSRKGVESECYMVLGKSSNEAAFKVKRNNQKLWDLAIECQREAYGRTSFHCTSLAVTKNFTKSPHLDMRDTTFQFAASFGDADGELCIERDDGSDIAVVSTLNKIVKVDGRFLHWVKDYQGERFSLIWFSVDEEVRTAPVHAVFDVS